MSAHTVSPHIVDIHEGNFIAEVIEASQAQPVLIDFWAPWCGPCRQLLPLLERLAVEMNGAFRLARINADQNPQLCQQFGVRGIPAVRMVIDGAVRDEFNGALSEAAVRDFLRRWLPSPHEMQRRQAAELLASGQTADARALLQAILAAAPDLDAAWFDLADCELALGNADAARAVFERLSPAGQLDARAERLRARLEFSASGDQTIPDPAALQASLAGQPDDHETRLTLARHLIATGQHQVALDHLLYIVGRDRSFADDAGRKTMLQVFELLGADHPLTADYRRRLARLLN